MALWNAEKPGQGWHLYRIDGAEPELIRDDLTTAVYAKTYAGRHRTSIGALDARYEIRSPRGGLHARSIRRGSMLSWESVA